MTLQYYISNLSSILGVVSIIQKIAFEICSIILVHLGAEQHIKELKLNKIVIIRQLFRTNLNVPATTLKAGSIFYG